MVGHHHHHASVDGSRAADAAVGVKGFQDVGGLSPVISLLRDLVEGPIRDSQLYQEVGVAPPRGLLLHGPPGVGKTLLARAVAAEVGATCYFLSSPELVGGGHGETEGNLRKLFDDAGEHEPSIIVIDEVDALLPKRGQLASQSDVRMVAQLLSLLDGLASAKRTIVIGTTNRLESVDSAFRRPGRFDRELFVGPPSPEERVQILGVHANRMTLSARAQEHLPVIGERTSGYVGADLMDVCREAGLNAVRRLRRRREADCEGARVAVEPEDFEAALSTVRPSALRGLVVAPPRSSWADVQGLEGAKRRLERLVVGPLREPDRYRAVDAEAPKGAFLYGPAGTGKSLLAEAVAREAGANILLIEAPEIFSPWLGESEGFVRDVFRIAKNASPAVVVIDQLDVLGGVGEGRGEMGAAARVRSQLLAEIDAIEPFSQVAVIGVARSSAEVDPAILRPGRLSIHIAMACPDKESRYEIARHYLRPTASGVDADSEARAIASVTDGWSGAEIRGLVDHVKLDLVASGRAEIDSSSISRSLATLLKERETLDAARA